MGEYEVPLDEQLRIQATEQIVCTDLCMFRDHCDGFCIANQEWKESIIFETAVLTATPFFAVLSQYLSIFLTAFGESAAEDLFFIKCHSTYFPFFSIFFIVIITLKKTIWRKGD